MLIPRQHDGFKTTTLQADARRTTLKMQLGCCVGGAGDGEEALNGEEALSGGEALTEIPDLDATNPTPYIDDFALGSLDSFLNNADDQLLFGTDDFLFASNASYSPDF
jgi:hypothetical protein